MTYITSRDFPESPVTNQSDCLFTAARADAAEGLSALAGVSAFVGREQSSWILLSYLWSTSHLETQNNQILGDIDLYC